MQYLKARKTNLRLEAVNRELDYQRSRDPLTALYNRRYFQEYFDKINFSTTDRRQRQTNQVSAMYLVDIDAFKKINDVHGHAAGDKVLVEVAGRLNSGLRDSDIVVRWGGEEFLIYAPKVARDEVTALAERLLRAVGATPIIFGDIETQITASIGYTVIPLPSGSSMLSDWACIYHIIDTAMYMAKAQGRNRAHGIFELGDNVDDLERNLEAACNEGKVSVTVSQGPGDVLAR